MSSLYRESDIALPRTGLLSYFRQSTNPPEIDDGHTTVPMTRTPSPFPHDTKRYILDEEFQCGFWDLDSDSDTDGEISTHSRPGGVFHSLYDFWRFICVVTLASCAILLGLDFALGQYGMGIGLTGCALGAHLTSPLMGHEV